MTKKLNDNDIRDIAEYTRIAVEENEISQLRDDLNSIIAELEPIKKYDLAGVEPTFHPIGGLSNVYREDVMSKSFTQEEALENAPKTSDGAFLIPSILGGNQEG